MKNKMKWLFPLIVVALLAPWPIAYAHDTDVNVSTQDSIRVEVAPPSAMPNWQVFGRAIGGVDTPGDLFYIDATENTIDITTTLYITNTNELIRCYGYLILEVDVYVEDNGEWKEATQPNDEPIPDTFITLQNGRASFTLAGYANYKITIDSGCFKVHRTTAEGGSVAPQFFLEVD